MKKNLKNLFPAKKNILLALIFTFSMFLAGGVNAQADCGSNSTSRDQCESVKGCFFDTSTEEDRCIKHASCINLKWEDCYKEASCSWYRKSDEKVSACYPKGTETKKLRKAVEKWSKDDCSEARLKHPTDIISIEANSEIYGEKDPFKDRFVKDACVEAVKKFDNPCAYPEWLNDKGKKNCRAYNDLISKANQQLCFEEVEQAWEMSLKDSNSREIRETGMEECRDNIYNDYYQGPVFDGPGLRGGAQIAQLELSNSISKQRDIKKLLISWSRFALEIAAVLAVLALIYAGFRYITDMGEGSGIEAAKKIIIWTIVGILLILGSYAIVNTVIKGTLEASIEVTKFIT